MTLNIYYTNKLANILNWVIQETIKGKSILSNVIKIQIIYSFLN